MQSTWVISDVTPSVTEDALLSSDSFCGHETMKTLPCDINILRMMNDKTISLIED